MDKNILGERPIITTIRGDGSVMGEFDRVRYQITIKGTGPTGSEAKKGVKKPLAALQNFLKEAENEGVRFSTSKTVSPYNISKVEHWDDDKEELIFSHYAATYSLSFVVLGVDAVTVMMDKLTEIEGLEVASPIFLMGKDQQEKLRDEALELAVKNAKDKFTQQCRLLDKNPADYEIWTWGQSNFGGTGIQGSTGSEGVLGSVKNYASRIVVSSGEAAVSASISLSYTPTVTAIADLAKDLMAEFDGEI